MPSLPPEPALAGPGLEVSVIVPTRNESGSVAALVDRVQVALAGRDAEILFVDDSDDDTPQVIGEIAGRAGIPVRMLHRERPEGGLAGAVVAGLRSSRARWCVVMDGDLQHPPEILPTLLAHDGADIVVGTRHRPGGGSEGLAGPGRHAVSDVSNLLARMLFPVRLRDCTDPMSGLFAVRRDRIDTERLHPRGFKILLEILARHRLRVAEVPFRFGERTSDRSKASAVQGLRYLQQLAVLRFGRMPMFAVIGGVGALLNLAIMALLVRMGMWYVAAAVIGGAVTIVTNFLLQEGLVFRDLRGGRNRFWARFAHSVTFDSAELGLRTALLWTIVRVTGLHSVLVQAFLLVLGFVARFAYRSLVVYRPRTELVPEPVPVPEDGVLPRG